MAVWFERLIFAASGPSSFISVNSMVLKSNSHTSPRYEPTSMPVVSCFRKFDLTLIAADNIELVIGVNRSLAPALGWLQVPLSIVCIRQLSLV